MLRIKLYHKVNLSHRTSAFKSSLYETIIKYVSFDDHSCNIPMAVLSTVLVFYILSILRVKCTLTDDS